MFYQETRKLIVEESDVTTVLATINRHQGFFSDVNKRVGECGWADEPTKWYVQFYASTKEWRRITKDLSELGEIIMKLAPGGATDMYYVRK